MVWSNQVETDVRRDIFGQRLSTTGQMLGSAFRISGPAGTGTEIMPAVVWNGAESLVVWVDDRNYEERGTDIYGRRVADDGTRPGSDFRISGTNAVESELGPAVAWNGVGYLVVWEDYRDLADRGVDVRGRRVTAAGAPEGRDFRISGTTADANDFHPRVASDGTGYLVVWDDERNDDERGTDIYGRRFEADGTPTGNDTRISGTPATADERSAAVACDQTTGRFLTVWQDSRNDGYPTFHGWDIFSRDIAA